MTIGRSVMRTFTFVARARLRVGRWRFRFAPSQCDWWRCPQILTKRVVTSVESSLKSRNRKDCAALEGQAVVMEQKGYMYA